MMTKSRGIRRLGGGDKKVGLKLFSPFGLFVDHKKWSDKILNKV